VVVSTGNRCRVVCAAAIDPQNLFCIHREEEEERSGTVVVAACLLVLVLRLLLLLLSRLISSLYLS
jgi:hypothetical protein